jgi:dephospho-CoA kinase
VIADEEIRVNRVLKRDKTNKKAVMSRIKQQLKDDKKIPLADFIIDNNGNKSILQQVLNIHKEILKKI